MATDYQSLFAQKSTPQAIASGAKRIRQLLDQYGGWIDKYRGGIPREFAAGIMMWESDGNFAAPGDPSLGEVGFYQVAAYVPSTFGASAEVRLNPEGNVFAGLLEYQLDMVRWAVEFPDYVELGTPDVLKLARLSFAVGWGGSTGLARMAISRGATYGALYDAIVDLVGVTGGTPLGSQSASQVWFRVVSIDSQWRTAEAASTLGWLSVGMPTFPPTPPGYNYEIPERYARFFQRPTSPLIVAAAVLGAIVLWRFYA